MELALDTWSAHLGKGSPPGVCPLLTLAGPGVGVDPQAAPTGALAGSTHKGPGTVPSITGLMYTPLLSTRGQPVSKHHPPSQILCF